MRKDNRSMAWLALLGLVLALAAPSAFAASLWTLSPSDKVVSTLITPVFGDAAGGNPGGPLAEIIKVFNGAILMIGGILAAYTLLAGTMSTAHDGEMLGKKWSSMWIPIRTAVGTALCIPLSSGFCAAQLIIFWLAFQGLALGGAMGSTFMSTLSSTGFAPTATMSDGDELARNILAMNLCVEAYNKVANKTAESLQAKLPLAKTSSGSNGGMNYGGGGGRSASNCGSVSFQPANVFSPKTSWVAATTETNIGQINQALTAQKSAFATLQSTLQPLAKQLVDAADNHTAPPSASTFTSAVLAYQTAITTAMKTPQDDAAFKAFTDAVSKDGIRDLGAFPMKAAFLQDKVSSAIKVSMPEAVVSADAGGLSAEEVSQYLEKTQAFYKQQAGAASDLTKSAGLASSEAGPITTFILETAVTHLKFVANPSRISI